MNKITYLNFSHHYFSLEPSKIEKELATKIFGEKRTRDLKHKIAPFPLILFCYREDEGFLGEDFGMFAKACNEFFPTPTDQGICLTTNMDTKEIFFTPEKASDSSIFDSHLQGDPLQSVTF